MKELEQKYINCQTIEHRKHFGQFYTLDKIARFMMHWVVECNPNTVCDPAFGMGVFYNEYKKIVGSNKPFYAMEIDKKAYDFYLSNTDKNLALKLKNEDYFNSWEDRYDAIVCNPPYLKFQKFENRKEILNKLSSFIGERVSGYTNTASAFLLKSITELNDGGRLAYIMPLEFLNTGYGAQVKRQLLQEGSIEQIIQITDETNAFKDVLTTVCIVFFCKDKKSQRVQFSKINSVEKMEVELCQSVPLEKLNPEDKWLPYFSSTVLEKLPPKDFVPLSLYGKFKRGIATGANEFFVLSKSDTLSLGLTESDYSCCVSMSRQVKRKFFDERDFTTLVDADDGIYLFSPNIPLSSKFAEKYIKFGESQKFHERYLTSKRKPWYSTEKREIAPIWLGVFSRDSIKIIRNMSNCVTLTCFHGFFPTPSHSRYIDKLFLFLLSDVGTDIINKNTRLYGNNLTKLEPNDLLTMQVPSTSKFDLLTDEFIATEMDFVVHNNCLSDAAQIAFEKLLAIN